MPTVTPGYKTSEFWLKLVALLLTFCYSTGVIPTSGTTAQIAAIAATILTALGYAVVRSQVKAAAMRASLAPAPAAKNPQSGKVGLHLIACLALVAVVSAGAMLGGCSWWSSTGKGAAVTAGKTAEACAVSDLEAYGGDIAKDLSGSDYSAALDKFKADHHFTQDAVNCLVQGLLAGIGAVVATEAHGEPTPLYLHGRAYLDAHQTPHAGGS